MKRPPSVPLPLPPAPQSPAPDAPRWFVLGREPLLSAAEIFSTLTSFPFFTKDKLGEMGAISYTPPVLRLQTHTFVPSELIKRLGGTIKIADELGTSLNEQELLGHMTAEAQTCEGKINFGISLYPLLPEDGSGGGGRTSVQKIERWAKEIKNTLKQMDRSVRYIESDEGILNSATVFHNHLDSKGREFLVIPKPAGVSPVPLPEGDHGGEGVSFDLAVTRAIQPLEDLSARDFGRPGRDDVSGMLPPKLAMMMINLAGCVPLPEGDRRGEGATILDPFCGSGTILTEAIRMGFTHITGTDISEKAVADTKSNVDWTLKELAMSNDQLTVRAQQCDVLHLSTQIPAHSIDAIATEPYMGPPLTGREQPEQIKKTCALLADLYVKAFEQFATILKPNGTVVFSIPRFHLSPPARGGAATAVGGGGSAWFTISDRIIPKLKELGFTKERLVPEELTPTSYILYHRPGQRVGREIWKFKKLA